MNATFKKNDRVRVLKVGGQMNKFAIVKGMCMNDTRVLVTMEEDGDVKSYLEEELALSTVLDRSLTTPPQSPTFRRKKSVHFNMLM
eukprot:g2382.t1